MQRLVTLTDSRDMRSLFGRKKTDETLFWWHCRCGYANVRYDPCFGCHTRAPRQIRRNTRADRVRRRTEAAEAVARTMA
jgi:hypothetical protein